jgi:hypothetical protein
VSLSPSLSEGKGTRTGVELHIVSSMSVSDPCTEIGESGEADLELEIGTADDEESGSAALEKRTISASGSHKTANVRPESAGTMSDHR